MVSIYPLELNGNKSGGDFGPPYHSAQHTREEGVDEATAIDKEIGIKAVASRSIVLFRIKFRLVTVTVQEDLGHRDTSEF